MTLGQMGGQRAVTQIQAAVGNERKRVICGLPRRPLFFTGPALYTQPERHLTQEPRFAAASVCLPIRRTSNG